MTRFVVVAVFLLFALCIATPAPASQAQHEVCSQATHAESAGPADSERPRIAAQLRDFVRAAQPSDMLSAEQQIALTAGGVSYTYSSLVCRDGSDFGTPHVGDTEHFPGSGAPNGSTMTVSSCSNHVQLVVSYRKTDDGWVVTEVHETHVAFCPLGN